MILESVGRPSSVYEDIVFIDSFVGTGHNVQFENYLVHRPPLKSAEVKHHHSYLGVSDQEFLEVVTDVVPPTPLAFCDQHSLVDTPIYVGVFD